MDLELKKASPFDCLFIANPIIRFVSLSMVWTLKQTYVSYLEGNGLDHEALTSPLTDPYRSYHHKSHLALISQSKSW